MDIYKKNLSVLDLIKSSLITSLNNVPDEIDYEVFMSENAFDTLNLVNKKTSKALYEGFAQDTVVEQAKRFEVFKKYPYLYFFGIGNGVFLKYLLQNEQHKRILIIEPDIQILYVVLNIIDFSEDIKSGRVLFLLQSDLTPPLAAQIFEESNVQRYARVYDLHVMCEYYEKYFALEIQKTNRMCLEAINNSVTAVGNDTKDSLIGLKQHIFNLPKVIQTPTIGSLVGSISTTDVAILVSTGPSLSKQLPLLKSIAPCVRIFAVDASLPILAKAGIKPDVVTSIERVALSARFFEETPKEAFKDVIFALSSLQHQKVIESIKDGTKLITLRPLGYMKATGPSDWGYIGIGMSSANMAYEIIYHSHFKTCILIGQDLAYGEDGSSHSAGHVFGENEVKEKEGDGYTVAYGGKGEVKTTHFWNMFRGYMEKDIVEVSKRMQTINATEGGARIFGTLEMPFHQAIKKHVQKKHKKSIIRLKSLNAETIEKIGHETDKKVDTICNYIKTLYTEVESLFLKVAKVNEHFEETDIKKLETILKEIENFRKHENDVLYKDVVWHIAQSMMLVQDMQIAPMYLQIDEDETQKKENLINLLKAYKPWLFSLAGILDAIVKTIDYAIGRRLIDEVEVIGVYIEDKCIDTFTCKDLKAKIGRVFDIVMRGILYDVPDEYQNNIDNVVFKNEANNEKLLKSFVSVFDRTDEKYNELSFMRSLEEPIDEEKIKDLYCKNAIGFLATEENLGDEDFVEYIRELNLKFPFSQLKMFYFDNKVKQLFDKLKLSNIQRIRPSSVLDIINEIEISIQYKNNKLFGNIILNHCPNIYLVNFVKNIHNELLGEYNNNSNNKTSLQIQNYRAFGYTEEDLKEAHYNINRVNFTKILRKIDSTCFIIDDEKKMHELLHIDSIYYALKYSEFKHHYFHLRAVMRKLLQY